MLSQTQEIKQLVIPHIDNVINKYGYYCWIGQTLTNKDGGFTVTLVLRNQNGLGKFKEISSIIPLLEQYHKHYIPIGYSIHPNKSSLLSSNKLLIHHIHFDEFYIYRQ